MHTGTHTHACGQEKLDWTVPILSIQWLDRKFVISESPDIMNIAYNELEKKKEKIPWDLLKQGVLYAGFLQTFPTKIHKHFTNFQDFFLKIKRPCWTDYSPTLVLTLYSPHVIHVHLSFHSSNAKILPLHNYTLYRPKYEAIYKSGD